MCKIRHRDQMDFRDENPKELFPWIDSIIPFSNFMIGISETWSIKFRKDVDTIPRGKKEFEEFIKSYFIAKRRKKGVIFCWQHMGVVIMVQ